MWGAASIIYDALHLKTTACLSLPHSLRLSLSPLIPIVTTSPGSPTLLVCIEGKRWRPVGWFGTSRHLMGDNVQEVQNQLWSLNYHSMILNFTYKHLWRLIGRFQCCRQQLQMTTDVCSTFILALYLQVCLAIVAPVISASIPRQNVPSLVRAFLSSCRFLCLKGSRVLSWHARCYTARNCISTLS